MIGSASRKGQAAQAPGARSPWPAASLKLVLIIFSPTIPLMQNAPQRKRQPHPSPAALATFCVKGWAAITLLQSTIVCVYVNNNRDTDTFYYIV